MKVLKYNDFINEGFMTRTLNRHKFNSERLENKYPDIPEKINNCDTYRVINYPSYFFKINFEDEYMYIDFYCALHDPITERLCYVYQSVSSGEVPEFTKEIFDDYINDDHTSSDEEWETINSEDFIKCLNKTLDEISKKLWK